jgi:hypothetical protein
MHRIIRGAAALLALAVAGCADADAPQVSDGVETFANPPELAPDADGVYQLRFGPRAVEIAGRRSW